MKAQACTFIAMMALTAAALAGPPASVNWVERGVVSPVKDQGMCGGDIAFATAGAVNSFNAIHKRRSGDISEQQLIDCAHDYGFNGCAGGRIDSAFKYIVAKGATTAAAYPYTQNGGTCRIDGGKIKIHAYKQLPGGDCKALEAAVAKQPVVVAIDALDLSQNSYKGGIYSSCGHSPNHAVLVVGYTPDYWLVQNSWGPSWGEQGYIRIKKGNTCGICEYAVFPTK